MPWNVLISPLQVRLVGRNPLLADIGRVADDDVEAALLEDLGEGGLPVERPGMDGRVGDDAVADADGVVEAGQRLAALGGLDPEAQAGRSRWPLR